MAEKRSKCHDCFVLEGEYHLDGCDVEICPICRGQLISCDCFNGFSGDKREVLIESYGGRIPFIHYPNICERCGKVNPSFFHAPDKEWKKYTRSYKKIRILCIDCYCLIKDWIDISEAE